MIARPAARIALMVCLAALVPTAASAGDLSGQVVLPKKRIKPPIKSQGFVKRKANPIMETQRFDPRPNIVVVLDGGPVGAEDKEPDRSGVKWRLLGESFDIPLLPIVFKTEIDLKNTGHGSPALYSPQDDDMIKPDPISPGGVRTFTVDEPGKAFELRARNTSHLVGRVIAFPHRFFARLDDNGRFEIKNVPEGNWKVKLWYKDGYLETTTDVEIGRRDKKIDPIKLPASIAPDSAGAGDK
jgi:hypothetical protein